MLPDRVSNPGPLTYESGALPIALRGPASRYKEELSPGQHDRSCTTGPGIEPRTPDLRVRCPTDCATRPGDDLGLLGLSNITVHYNKTCHRYRKALLTAPCP